MGSGNTKVKLEKIWNSTETGETFSNIFSTDTKDGVMVIGKNHLDSESEIFKGALVIGKKPSEDTLQAFDFVRSFEKSSLEEIKSGLEDVQRNPESKYKNQCLILLRNLYLIKSKPDIWEYDADSLLLPDAPLETWAIALG
jgi:hypothetical protein